MTTQTFTAILVATRSIRLFIDPRPSRIIKNKLGFVRRRLYKDGS